jgi:hypothetical protein
MAYNSRGFWANYVVVDISQGVSNMRVELQGAIYADAAADAVAFLPLLAAVTGGTIKRYDVTEVWDNDGWALSSNEVLCSDKGLITIALADTPDKKASVAIPAPKLSIMEDTDGEGYNKIDKTDSDVIAFVNAFVETTGYCKLSDGEYGLAVASGGFVKGRRVKRKMLKA